MDEVGITEYYTGGGGGRVVRTTIFHTLFYQLCTPTSLVKFTSSNGKRLRDVESNFNNKDYKGKNKTIDISFHLIFMGNKFNIKFA